MTSKLESYLSNELYTRFGQYSIKQNYRPDWLQGLELDFYIEELKLAAEVQGEQHYMFVEFFHGSSKNFESQKSRDTLKRILCREREIRLFEILTTIDADLFVASIKDQVEPEEQFPYSKKELKLLKSITRCRYNSAHVRIARDRVAAYIFKNGGLNSLPKDARGFYHMNEEEIDRIVYKAASKCDWRTGALKR